MGPGSGEWPLDSFGVSSSKYFFPVFEIKGDAGWSSTAVVPDIERAPECETLSKGFTGAN